VVQTPAKLPKFTNPPVVEVLLSAQFQQLAGMNVGHLGLLWERFKTKFPRTAQQPALPHIIERKGVNAAPVMPTFSLMAPADQVPRFWMIGEDDSDLVQVQSDRFMRNWRRYHNAEMVYPSYDGHNRPEFLLDFETFRSFVIEQGWGELNIDQCEVAYVNHIKPGKGWKDFSQLDRVFKGWASEYPRLAGSAANSIACRIRHEVSDGHDKFIGHLFIELDSAYAVPTPPASGELSPLFQLQLIVRGRPLREGVQGVMEFMDRAHSIIVKSFAAITTPKMHKIWERTQ
jgi:uncharacterized protein (TIGR04255 family)